MAGSGLKYDTEKEIERERGEKWKIKQSQDLCFDGLKKIEWLLCVRSGEWGRNDKMRGKKELWSF